MVGSEAQAEGLVVRGRTQERNSGDDVKGRSKSKNKDLIYRYCKKKVHIKSECYMLQNKNKRVATNQKRNNQKIPVKPVLQKIIIMMANSKLLLMATPNFTRIGFLILVARFLCVPIETGL